MLKKTVQYEDLDGKVVVEDLYFNLTRTEVADKLIDRLDQLQSFQERAAAAGEREMTNAETKEFLDILKYLVEISYGIRVDSKHFRKSPEMFADFRDSGAYDAFMFGMFEDIKQVNDFMIGIMPQNVIDEAAKTVAPVVDVKLPEDGETINGGELNATEMEVPAYIRENRLPTQKELSAMNPAELQEAFRRRMQSPEY